MGSDGTDAVASYVFLALCFNNGGPLSLTNLIAVYDMIHHAIPNRDELEHALNRLLAMKLVEQRGERFAIPAITCEDFEKFRRRQRKDEFTMAKAYIRRFGTPEVISRRVEVSESAYRSSITEYRARYWGKAAREP